MKGGFGDVEWQLETGMYSSSGAVCSHSLAITM